MELGPVLTASMTEYQIIENSNQQVIRNGPHMTLTPRIEYVSGETYTSLSDLKASVVPTSEAAGAVTITAEGRLLSKDHTPLPAGEAKYWLRYRATAQRFEIHARFETAAALPRPVSLIVPVISSSEEKLGPGANIVRIHKQKGTLVVHTDAVQGFRPVAEERTFNLVPGFECVPLIVDLKPGEQVTVVLEAGPV
jgi:hypothetical protein